MDEASGLPYHGFDSDTGVKYGIIGWGRAVGWLMSGISESLAYLPEKTPQFSFLRDHFQKLSAIVVGFQKEDGSFPWQLQAQDGPSDSSATAMIACALLRGMQFENLDGHYEENVLRAAEYLLAHMKNGRWSSVQRSATASASIRKDTEAIPGRTGLLRGCLGMMEEV